ncbi:MAG: hypothetical protein RI989_1151, partial [Bacteroidota bacterium]
IIVTNNHMEDFQYFKTRWLEAVEQNQRIRQLQEKQNIENDIMKKQILQLDFLVKEIQNKLEHKKS